MKYLTLILIVICFFSGCSNNRLKEPVNDDLYYETHGENEYNKFILNFRKTDLYEQGINVETILDGLIEYTETITEVKYTTEKCNFSGKNNLIMVLNFTYELHSFNKSAIIIFETTKQGKYNPIFVSVHNHLNYECDDLIGNDGVEIILKADNSGNNKSENLIKILVYNTVTNEIDTVFEEILYSYPYLPYKSIEGNDFYSISINNNYELVQGTEKSKDIILNSKLIVDENTVLEEGFSKFVFDGNKYTAENYYDYKSRATEIYNSAEDNGDVH